MKRLFTMMLAVCALVAAPSRIVAQETFPNRPITVVVPFPPGGVADLTARPVADRKSVV